MKTRAIICLFLIFFLAILLRFYRLTINPPHLYWDEASIAYNAYSINQTGRDEWGKSFPLAFRAFGDYKLPLYVYLTAISQKIFGLTDFAVRFPSALAGSFTVVAIYFLVHELTFFFKNKLPGTNSLAAFLLAISPWHLQFSRGGFEANFGLFCQVVGVWLFILAVRKNGWFFPASFIFFSGAIYSYHGAVITTVLLIALLFLLFRKNLFAQKKQIITGILVFFIILGGYLPNYLHAAGQRVGLTGESFLQMKGNPATNFLTNYLGNFSFDYLFFHGDQDGRHSVKKLGELYLWQLPAVLVGGYFLLKKRSKATTIIIGGILFGALPPTLTLVSPHALRGLGSVYFWQIISAIGLVFLFSKINLKLRLFVIPIIMYALLVYLHIYYVHYPKAYSLDWQDGERQAITYIKNIKEDYLNIFVYKSFDPIYIMLYWPINPKQLQLSGHNTKQMDKLKYFDYTNLPTKENFPGKNLLLVPEWFSYDESKLLRQINLFGGDAAYKIYEL